VKVDPLILNLALNGNEWSASNPSYVTVEEEEKHSQYSWNRRLHLPQNQSGCLEKLKTSSLP